jgi:hypothetical protein
VVKFLANAIVKPFKATVTYLIQLELMMKEFEGKKRNRDLI